MVFKHWRGFLNCGQLTNPKYLSSWIKEAEKSNNREYDLLIFQVPKLKSGQLNSELVNKIEQMIQDIGYTKNSM